ncbi:uncharacterized protein LOC142335151 [Convolutriloba macropyga]|uniref:uncharacterized protein LOC142335151 n=1 Tax=Convolutriloba macropyga TaxID=536237 RepID=UPI003F523A2B
MEVWPRADQTTTTKDGTTMQTSDEKRKLSGVGGGVPNDYSHSQNQMMTMMMMGAPGSNDNSSRVTPVVGFGSLHENNARHRVTGNSFLPATPNDPSYPTGGGLNGGNGGGGNLARSRNGSNVTIMGSPNLRSSNNNGNENQDLRFKKPSTTTTIVDDAASGKPSISITERIESVLGVMPLHIGTSVVSIVLLIAALTFYFLLVFKLAVFRNRREGTEGMAGILKLVPNEFNVLSFALTSTCYLLQIVWQCYMCFKIKLSCENLRGDSQFFTSAPWTVQIVFQAAMALEIGNMFTVSAEVHWLSTSFSAVIFLILCYCLKQHFNSLIRNQHVAFLWSNVHVSHMERYFAQNALAALATLRLVTCVFYLGVTLNSQVGLSVLLSDLVIFLTSLAIISIFFVFEVFVLGDVSTLYFTPWPVATLLFLNTMLSNVKHGKVLEMYFCAFLLGSCCFILCIKIVITMELKNQSPDKENFSYMTTGYQFALNTREGRSARSRSARASSTHNRSSATVPRSRKSTQNRISNKGIITVTHEMDTESVRNIGQEVQYEPVPVSPVATQSVTDLVGHIEEFHNHHPRVAATHQDSNALEDSGVSFMEFQNEFCRHYPNYGFIDNEQSST